MSTAVKSILEQVRALPPAELEELSAEILRLDALRKGWEENLVKLRKIQAQCAGSGMLKKLLEMRAGERARVGG